MSREHESSIMSSPMNNNCVIAASSSVADSSRRPANLEQSSQPARRGRSGRPAGRGRQRPMSTRSCQITQNLLPKLAVQDDTAHSGQDQSPQIVNHTGPKQPGESNRSNRKYRQRDRANQLLESMSNMATIELTETDSTSIASSSSTLARNEMSRAQHKLGRKVNLTHMINNKIDGQRHRQPRQSHL